jgi:hypothetical protein
MMPRISTWTVILAQPPTSRHSERSPKRVVILSAAKNPRICLCRCLFLLSSDPPINCHPERSLSQSHRERRSRRTPIQLAPPQPSTPFSLKSPPLPFPLLLGTPSLQAWPSHDAQKKWDLAPGVCLLSVTRKTQANPLVKTLVPPNLS